MIAVWGIYTLLTTTDVLVLQLFRPSDEVAHYYAASKTMTLVTFVYFMRCLPRPGHRFSALACRRRPRRASARFTATAIHWIFWPSLAAALM